MADILEEALADAEKLQKAAQQSAESNLLEKNHEKVKKETEKILEAEEAKMMGEQEDEEFGGEEELGLGDEEFDFEDEDEEFGFEGDDSGLDNQVPDAMADGEDLCPCPEDDEEIEINFDELAQQIEKGDSQESHEEAAEEVVGDEEGMLEEEIDIDMEPTKSGTTNRPQDELDREMEKDFSDDEEDEEGDEEIQDNSDVLKLKEQISELKREVRYLKKKNQKIKEGKKDLKEERDKYRSKLLDTSKQLKESNSQRAKFFYKTCVLENSSLNERQKQRLAEALEDAESAKEAKNIYEHVSKALEGATETKKSNFGSIDEAVDNSMPQDSPRIPGTSDDNERRQKRGIINENMKKRMQELANIQEN